MKQDVGSSPFAFARSKMNPIHVKTVWGTVVLRDEIEAVGAVAEGVGEPRGDQREIVSIPVRLAAMEWRRDKYLKDNTSPKKLFNFHRDKVLHYKNNGVYSIS